MEDAVEKVIDGLNSDGNSMAFIYFYYFLLLFPKYLSESIATLKYDNRPQAHAIIKEGPSSSVEDKIDIVAATIAAEAKEFENKIASQVSDRMNLVLFFGFVFKSFRSHSFEMINSC